MVVERQFQRRAQRVPRLGLGLSVDVYSPDLWDLIRRFEGRAVRPAYLEIFRATATALQAVRQSFPTLPLTYHGEGLWITQPEFGAGPCWEKELDDVASQLRMLRSPWLNHECATKQMGGYSFGTYLPPLYTAESANLVADNITLVQERLENLVRCFSWRCRRSRILWPGPSRCPSIFVGSANARPADSCSTSGICGPYIATLAQPGG